MQGQARHAVRLILDRHVKAPGGIQQPAEHRLLTAEAVVIRAKAEQGAVVDQHPFFVAPQSVADPTFADLADVAGHHPFQHRPRLWPADPVFVHGRNVEKRRLIADGEILELHRVEDEGRDIARPIGPAFGAADRLELRQKRGGDQAQRNAVWGGGRNGGRGAHAHVSFSRCRAELRPGAPVRSPPG